MTTEDNIRRVQEAYALYGRQDLDGLLAMFDEKIEWSTPESMPLPSAGKLSGREQVAGFFRTVWETWHFEAFEPREFLASGDRVIVLGHYRGRARGTGSLAQSDWVMAFRLDGGKFTHFQEYSDTAVMRDALTARAAA